MNYALIENGVVQNIIWLSPSNTSDFPEAVLVEGIPAQIGDTYENELFYRNGERILTRIESLNQANFEQALIIAELDDALLDMTYDSIMGGLEE